MIFVSGGEDCLEGAFLVDFGILRIQGVARWVGVLILNEAVQDPHGLLRKPQDDMGGGFAGLISC